MNAAENHGNGNSGPVFVKVKSDTMKGDSSLTGRHLAHRNLFSPATSLHWSLPLHFPSPRTAHRQPHYMLMFLSMDPVIEKNFVVFINGL